MDGEGGPMWAPWRMDYILGEKPKGCVFCSFTERRSYREDLVLVMQANAFACLNKYPFAPAHVLVIPRRHVSNLEDLSEEEYAALMALLRESNRALKAAVRPEGANIGFNLGKAAGAGIAEHLHAHIVPRWVGDSNFMPVIASTRVMPEYLDQTWAKLRVAFDAVPGDKAPLP
jgi:ATP adenylyltransferase